jgi:hypothetical protein
MPNFDNLAMPECPRLYVGLSGGSEDSLDDLPGWVAHSKPG